MLHKSSGSTSLNETKSMERRDNGRGDDSSTATSGTNLFLVGRPLPHDTQLYGRTTPVNIRNQEFKLFQNVMAQVACSGF